jgi:hypothetical protein
VQAWPEQGRKRDRTQKHTYFDIRIEEVRYPSPLMGIFSPMLSSMESDTLWEPENLTLVRQLAQRVYAQIVRGAQQNHKAVQSIRPEEFPISQRLKCFYVAFLEELNQLFPLIPTFNPERES